VPPRPPGRHVRRRARAGRGLSSGVGRASGAPRPAWGSRRVWRSWAVRMGRPHSRRRLAPGIAGSLAARTRLRGLTRLRRHHLWRPPGPGRLRKAALGPAPCARTATRLSITSGAARLRPRWVAPATPAPPACIMPLMDPSASGGPSASNVVIPMKTLGARFTHRRRLQGVGAERALSNALRPPRTLFRCSAAPDNFAFG
jgi:hypothetical protein